MSDAKTDRTCGNTEPEKAIQWRDMTRVLYQIDTGRQLTQCLWQIPRLLIS